MEAINAMLFYLNERLGRETSGDEKARRHTQMLWRHRDVLLKDYKYQIRTNNKPYWTWERRTVRGAEIKYRPVSDSTRCSNWTVRTAGSMPN